jgi:protein ImuB
MGRQGGLFSVMAARDLEAGARAVALLKARFGNDAVVRARLKDSHILEEQFAWDPIDSLGQGCVPQPDGSVRRRTAVRRILLTPERHHITRSVLSDSDGPFKICDRWWTADGEESVERDYYYLKEKRGPIRWIYFDRRALAWFLQGVVD